MGHVLAFIFIVALAASSDEPAGPNADLGGRLLLPAGDEWNRDVSRDAVDPNSDAIIGSIGADKSLHEDFGVVWKVACMERISRW